MILYVVGIGPGRKEEMTIEAYELLKKADIIVGYKTYVELLKEFFPEKEFFQSTMKKETERVDEAFRLVQTGKDVCLVSSGDAGIYGLASLAYERRPENVEVKVISGVSALSSGASRLGAPLGHDFAVISLSDLLTPLEEIFMKVELASKADFNLVIYNPSSIKRHDYLKRAVDIMLQYKDPTTPAGLVRQIGRNDEHIEVCTLKELLEKETDMFTTVFVGSKRTKTIDGFLVTSRGYDRK
ncbi:precorrin-3B C(17)-methyltransferase [Guggenheimella bovis]